MGWRRPFHFHRSKNRSRSIISLESRGATRLERESPGSSPGISAEQLRNLPSGTGSTYVTCIDFCAAEARAIDILDIDASHRRTGFNVTNGLIDFQLDAIRLQGPHEGFIKADDILR